MIINDKIKKDLYNLQKDIDIITQSNSFTDVQLENFLKCFEKSRYNILSQIKIHNQTVEFEYEKIKTIDDEYKAELKEDILKIYIPEVLLSYRNIKTHSSKRILLNVSEITKPFANKFENDAFIYIKVFDNIPGWDVDNKYIKPISDALISSQVIKDDNSSKMSYYIKGEFSDNPHTEVYVSSSKNIAKILQFDSF